MREPLLSPTEGARRLMDVPLKELYLGFMVRSLSTGQEGMFIEIDYKDKEEILHLLWKDGKTSYQVRCNYDLVEELLARNTHLGS